MGSGFLMTWVMRHEFGSQSLVLKLLLIFSSDDWQGPAPKSCPLSLESACGSRAKWHRTSGSHLASLPPSAAPKFCCFKFSLSGQLSNDSRYIFLYFFPAFFVSEVVWASTILVYHCWRLWCYPLKVQILVILGMRIVAMQFLRISLN